jgi:hypothetical protein
MTKGRDGTCFFTTWTSALMVCPTSLLGREKMEMNNRMHTILRWRKTSFSPGNHEDFLTKGAFEPGIWG